MPIYSQTVLFNPICLDEQTGSVQFHKALKLDSIKCGLCRLFTSADWRARHDTDHLST